MKALHLPAKENAQRYLGTWAPEATIEEIADGAYALVRIIRAERKPSALLFRTNSQKPVFFFNYKTVERMEEHIAEQIANIHARIQQKAADKIAKAKTLAEFVNPFAVGDVVTGSWGYDQTRVEAYQVSRIVGRRSVEIRPIATVLTDGAGSAMAGYETPQKDQFTGPAERKIVATCGRIRLHDHCSLGKWEGRPLYSSWYA